jgi:ABC-2 type transport system permease protein
MRLFEQQLWFELLKLFTRKRTYLGFVAFLGVEMLIMVLGQTSGAAKMLKHSLTQNGLDFSHYFSGLTLAHMMVTATVFLLGSLYLALVCGDMVAKEVEDGTMRMVLSRPVSRFRVLLLKFLACVVYTWALVLFIIGTSLALGIAAKGLGGLIVMSPSDQVFGYFEMGPGLLRFALGTVFLGLVMLTLSSLAFMFSCFNIKPASATIATLSIYFIDTVLRAIPYFKNIHGWLLSQHMAVWVQCFEQDLPWGRIVNSLLYLGGFDILFLVIGAAYFFRRDFKS